jgi:hypothetical protein
VAVDASGVSRRYAFVQYEKEEEAEKAIDVMDQIKILVSSTLNCLLEYAVGFRVANWPSFMPVQIRLSILMPLRIRTSSCPKINPGFDII